MLQDKFFGALSQKLQSSDKAQPFFSYGDVDDVGNIPESFVSMFGIPRPGCIDRPAIFHPCRYVTAYGDLCAYFDDGSGVYYNFDTNVWITIK